MEETIVTLITAKLADNKGFNIPCRDAYDTIIDELNNSVFYNGNNVFEVEDIQNATENSGNKHVLAPTQSLLQKWLREVHKIYLTILPWRDHQDDVNDDCRFRPMIVGIKTFNEYNTWEEALEIGLQEGLKLIK